MRRRLVVVAATVPLLFVLHSRLDSPRPFTVSEIDIEHDYYYNAQLLARGLPVGSSHHPGTPVYYLSGALLRLSGAEFGQAQRFFGISYAVVAVASAAAVGCFCQGVLGSASPGAALAVLALLLSWPPVLSYWTYYGADSWSLFLGLLAVTFFWRDLSSSADHPIRGALCGAAAGLGLAVKMTFLPFVLSLLLGKAVLTFLRCRREWRAGGGDRAKRLGWSLASSSVLPAAFVAAYLLATAPILGRLPALWLQTFQRPEVRPPAGAFAASLGSSLMELWRWNPALSLTGVLTLVVFLSSVLALVVPRLQPRKARDPVPASAAGEFFEPAAAGAFLAVLLAAFLYTLASSVVVTPGAELGIRLRNTAPSALVLPLMLLFVDRVGAWPFRRTGSRSGSWLPAALGIFALVVGWTAITGHRRAFVSMREARSREVRSSLLPTSPPRRRVAIWTESADDHLGDRSFHFWGNYRYGYDRFDEELLKRFPDSTFFRLRDVARLAKPSGDPSRTRPADGEGSTGRATSRYGRLGGLFWRVSHWLPRAFPSTMGPYERTVGLFTGEAAGVEPSVFAFAESQIQELKGLPLSSLVGLLEDRFGPVRVEPRTIGGEGWILLHAAGGPGATSGPP